MREKGDVIVMSISYPNYFTSVHSLNQLPFSFFFWFFVFHFITGIRVLVKCDRVKKLSMAITDGNGAFRTDLPSNAPTLAAPTSPNCLAKLVGGPTQLYAWKKNMFSKIVITQGDDESTYALESPLSFSKSCPGKCESVGSSKTIDLPVPPEYGLPPTSYYTPFFPIIGIP